MTDHGQRCLDALSDGQWWTVPELAIATMKCQRLTRSTLMGAVVAGLVEREVDQSRGYVYRAVE